MSPNAAAMVIALALGWALATGVSTVLYVHHVVGWPWDLIVFVACFYLFLELTNILRNWSKDVTRGRL